ncbi:putative cytosol aminopeptidase [Candidatus Clavichlamydia salmonicola]|uniref:leucyl aminopeptidase n=1 Tax=Candidatus Clavichlamydia salmonicola TaxID=469812 RepID=UPI0018912BC8|nr:leucyl aminopeptidase [Candidatus Clavichlamydia salmonicola]MBF5051150.1 putative cytosol aminopeptidase [Candidatus Clavichlamydia salmonicola]
MLLSAYAEGSKRKTADVAIFPFWLISKKPLLAIKTAALPKECAAVLTSGDFTGKEGEICTIYLDGNKEKRAVLLGLGNEETLDAEILKGIYGKLAFFCRKANWLNLNIFIPEISQLRVLSPECFVAALLEGIYSANYQLPFHGNPGEELPSPLLTEVHVVGMKATLFNPIAQRVEIIMEGVFLARDLVNGNADRVTPFHMATVATDIAKQIPGVKVEVWDEARLAKENMGLVLAVAKGATNKPRFIILKYRGHPKSKDHTVIIGKGVTYDTGGLDLKPGNSMLGMKADMAGGAAVLSTLGTVASLSLKVNVTAVIPCVENAISANSYKMGDVYTSCSGDAVEIISTDAEGRLILADALAYTIESLKPSRIIDLATLTGSICIALGDDMAGLFSNNEELTAKLLAAGKKTGDMLWAMPLHMPYKKMLKSDIATMKNCGGREAGSVTAALFLHHFVKNVPWAHLDIAGTAFQKEQNNYLPKHATGYGVRLLVEFLNSFAVL